MEVVAAGVCHSDYHLIDGHMQPLGLPWVLGHEGSGVVREVGPGVTSLAPGDKVILSLLDEINEAFDDMNAGTVARTVLTFD